MSYNKAITQNKKEGSYFSIKDIGAYLLNPNLEPGIDKVKLVFQIQRILRPYDRWDSRTRADNGEPKSVRSKLKTNQYGEVVIGASQNYSGLYGWVEFNPSKSINLDGQLADFHQTKRAIDVIFETVKENLLLARPTEYSRIHRLDLTVDIDPVADMLGALEMAKRCKPYLQQKASTYFHPNSIETQTVMFSTRGMGSVLFYNKSAETKKQGNRFRIEVQAGKRDLEIKLGPKDLKSLTKHSLQRIFRRRIDTFAMLCYANSRRHVDEILMHRDLTQHFIDIAGFEYLGLKGISVQKSDHHLKKDRQFKKTYNYSKIEDLI